MSWWNRTKLLELNERDEHDGEAVRVGDWYIRVGYDTYEFVISRYFYTMRHRSSTRLIKVQHKDIEPLRKIIEMHDKENGVSIPMTAQHGEKIEPETGGD